MTTNDQMDRRVEELGRASRRTAVLSLVGFLLVLGAIGYAIMELRALENQRESLLTDLTNLRIEKERYKTELTSARADLAKARASISAARAAINAFYEGQLSEAVALYDEALAADPDNAYLQNLRAYSLFRLGRIESAIAGQRRSLAADPKYAWGYFDLARFLCAASPPQFEEAKKAAAKATELRPDMRSIMRSDGEFQRLCRPIIK